MISIEDREEIYRVPIGNNGENEYVLRGLRENEVRIWSYFCAGVFSYKTNPPPAEYFYRHYANDPSTKAIGSSKLIRVAICQNEIIASCRIFLRTVSAGKERNYINAGGIGEVCTAVEHRRRGISKKLLENAIAIMEEKPDLDVSSLHAAKTFFPLYESLGYVSPPPTNHFGGNRWSTVTCTCLKNICPQRIFSKSNNAMDRELYIRPAKFPTETETLQKLHATYSEERFAGCIRRSQEYWNDYLSKELEGSLFVLVLKRTSPSSPGRECEMNEQILSWLSLSRSKGDADRDDIPSFNVVEFGMDAPFIESDAFLSKRSVVGALVAHAIDEKSFSLSQQDYKRMAKAKEADKEVDDSNPSTNPNPNSSASGDQGPSNNGNQYSKSKAEKHLDNWDQRGHDFTTFPKIIRNVDYFPWREIFIQWLKHERMLFFTDPDPQFDKDNIIDGYELELYDRKNTFFWLILLHSIQNSTARAILNKFKCDEPDARAAFLAINERMSKGPVQYNSCLTAFEELDALNIQTFTGTRTHFLTLWYEKLRQYNMINESEFMNYLITRSYLEKAVRADPDLLRVFDELDAPLDWAKGGKAFDLMYKSLFDRALIKDESDDRTKQRITTNNHLMEQLSEQHQAYPAYISFQADDEIYRASLDSSLKIPNHVYSNLSQDGKVRFRSLPAADRRILVSAMTINSGFKPQSQNRKPYEAIQSQEEYDFIQDIIQDDDSSRAAEKANKAYNKFMKSRKNSFSLQLPSFLADEIRCDNFEKDANDSVFSFDWESERTHTDHGWMYRGLGKSANGLGKSESEPLTSIPVEFLSFIQTEHPREHFVWPSDSF